MKRFVCLVLLMLGVSFSSWADGKRFGYLYEADSILEKGHAEYEQWLTYRGIKDTGSFHAWDIRHELEYGLASRLTTALYLNYKYTHSENVPGVTDQSSFEFEGVSSEWKYSLLSPNAHPIGVLLYGEVTFRGDELELEPMLVLQHNFGEKWILVVNLKGEHEWEFSSNGNESEFKLELLAGLAYKINPHWSIGLEARSHSLFPHYSEHEATALFVGPAVHYENSKWWVTFSALPQVWGTPTTEHWHDLVKHEYINARLILGIEF